MTPSGWQLASWIGVLVLTGLNIFGFWKLTTFSKKMLNMAFPGASSMEDALSQMQSMMRMGKRGRKGLGGAMPGAGGADAQLKAAMSLLQKYQGTAGKKR